MEKKDLKKRTKEFAIDIFNFVDELPNTPKGWTISKQILRSGSSVGANYRAACRAKSDRDFISKMETVIEEADETQFWLEMIDATQLAKHNSIEPLLKESDELVRIFVSSVKTVKNRINKNSSFRNQKS